MTTFIDELTEGLILVTAIINGVEQERMIVNRDTGTHSFFRNQSFLPGSWLVMKNTMFNA